MVDDGKLSLNVSFEEERNDVEAIKPQTIEEELKNPSRRQWWSK
jgi:hypothetical protein